MTRLRQGERGNVLILSFLLVTLLVALATAFFAVVQKNSRQSRFVNELVEMRQYAESGINLAIHELNYGTGLGDGNLGTERWTPANDVGRDGMPATGDEGENDTIPTPGEPNLLPVSVGPPSLGAGILVRTTDAPWPGVKRIVATGYDPEAIGAVEVYVRGTTANFEGAGAVYLKPGAAVEFSGAFKVNGNDMNPDRSRGPAPAVYGIATDAGNPPGSNKGGIVDQIHRGRENSITGLGGTPSINESAPLDLDQLADAFKTRAITIPPGNYNHDYVESSMTSFKAVQCNGNLHLSGNGHGFGVLIVDGTLTISGSFEFTGIVIVRGDVTLTGGGSMFHVIGGLMVGPTVGSSRPDHSLVMTGTSDVRYSSEAITKASALLGTNYTILYWNTLK